MLTVLGGLAEFERELIRSRTSEGRGRAKAKGVMMGRKPKLTHHQRLEVIGDGKPVNPWSTSAGPTTSATAPSAGSRRADADSVNVASFALRGCPVVAKTAIPTSEATRTAEVAIRL